MLGYFYQRSSGVIPGRHHVQPRATLGPLKANGLTIASSGLGAWSIDVLYCFELAEVGIMSR